MCLVNILVNLFSNISTVGGYITGSIASPRQTQTRNKKQESALGTWRLVEMRGTSQVHRWTGIDQTYQTPDLDTRGYVSENGLDADAKHSKTSACGLFLKSDSQEVCVCVCVFIKPEVEN